MQTSEPAGGVNISVCADSSSVPSVQVVVDGAQVGPDEHFTAFGRAFVSSVSV